MGKVNDLTGDGFRRMMRDFPRNALPKGAAWTIQDAIPNLGAHLRNRGGWYNYSDDISGASAGIDNVGNGIYADQLATPKLLALCVNEGVNWHLVSVATDGTGDVTDIGVVSMGGDPSQPMVQIGGKAIITDKSGTAVPRKYDGAAIANLSGSPPTARYAAVWKALLLLANTSAQPQRLYFSTADNNPESWDTTNTFWDFSYPIVGLAPLRNSIMVFHDDYTSRLTGSTPPPGGDLSADDPLFNIGCVDVRSIAAWGERVVWANTDGIYLTDGIIPNDVTRMCGMKSYWRELMSSYSSTWSIVASVLQNNYIISVMDGATFKDAAMIDLQQNSWVKLTNLDARCMWRTTALDGSERVFFGRKNAPRVGELSSMWTPSSTYKNDGDGDAVAYQLETPFYEFGKGIDLVRDLYVAYDLRDAATDNPTLSVGYCLHPEDTSYTTASSLTETTARERKRVTVNRTGLGFGLKISQSNASSDSRLWGIQAEGYGLEENRLV